MTSTIQKACCCEEDTEDGEYVEFILPPTCSDSTGIGCDCGPDDVYRWRGPCGQFNPQDFECPATEVTGCPSPSDDDCSQCGAVYMLKTDYLKMVLHRADGSEPWTPQKSKVIEQLVGWWQSGAGAFQTTTCTVDTPSTLRTSKWDGSAPCFFTTENMSTSQGTCNRPIVLTTSDSGNPTNDQIISTIPTSNSNTIPGGLSAANISKLNVGLGDAWFAIVFYQHTGQNSGRRRIFDQGDDNFGLILDDTTLKACIGSETNSAQTSANDGWNVVVAKRVGGSVTADLNGVAFTTSGSSNDVVNSSDTLNINASSGGVLFEGRYAELMVGIGELEDERELTNYLAHKYNIESVLPSDNNEEPGLKRITPVALGNNNLAGHLWKVSVGPVLPVYGPVGDINRCDGLKTVTIGSGCRTINESSFKRDCAGNIMFYGPDHPADNGYYAASGFSFPGDLFEWACYSLFWTDSTPCPDGYFCPRNCPEGENSYDNNYNYVSTEWARGLWEVDCDDLCSGCNPTSGVGKRLQTDTQACTGSYIWRPGGSSIHVDPYNALYGVTNYSNQDRCDKEFDGTNKQGNISECCGQDGDENAAFLDRDGSHIGPGITCEQTCFDYATLSFITATPPYDSCDDAQLIKGNGYCDRSGTVNCSCPGAGPEAPTSIRVSIPGYAYPATNDGACLGGGSGDCGELGITCSTDEKCGSVEIICRANWGLCPDGIQSESYCGCNTCTEDDYGPGSFCGCCGECDTTAVPLPEGCGAAQPGYGGGGLQNRSIHGLRYMNSQSIVLPRVFNTYEAVGSISPSTDPQRGLLTVTTISSSQAASAMQCGACNPPGDILSCPEFGYPHFSGIRRIDLNCVTDENSPELNFPSYYELEIIGVYWRRDQALLSNPYARPCINGSTEYWPKYRKISTSFDPSGTYTKYTPPGSNDQFPYHPATIEVE